MCIAMNAALLDVVVPCIYPNQLHDNMTYEKTCFYINYKIHGISLIEIFNCFNIKLL